MAHATRQHGVISTVELRRFGLMEKAIRWRAATGILQPLFVGVFLVAGSPQTLGAADQGLVTTRLARPGTSLRPSEEPEIFFLDLTSA
ncbi:MAG: hypothetical protein JWL57_2337 [Actinobacteria bacterium]|jgi:hypothetical protein|nr:hypothetical protein [Actinomycetota bacterium]